MKQPSTLLWLLLLPAITGADTNLDKGKYLFQLANCYACHTDTPNDGPALAGGRALETEFGTFYTPNITSDKQTGIGNWNDQQFIMAVREGIAPDGSHYYPSFPYPAYRNISDNDLLSIKQYLFSLPPVKQTNKEHQLNWYVSRLLIGVWKVLNDFSTYQSPAEHRRGAYLLDTLGHCNECHTPRNSIGILQFSEKFKGNKTLSAPDITSGPEGIADWDTEELEDLFSDGALPDGDYVSEHMAEVVEFSTSKWTKDDRQEAIEYLREH